MHDLQCTMVMIMITSYALTRHVLQLAMSLARLYVSGHSYSYHCVVLVMERKIMC